MDHAPELVSPPSYVLQVPDLKDAPSLGSGCCAVGTDYLMELTLREVDGVLDALVSEEEGVVRVWVKEDSKALREALVERIADFGFEVMATDC